MPAKIVIVSGLSSGAELWIEEMVSRLGSDPHCQLCVADAGLAAHAATLEFRAGHYLLHNRGELPVVLAGRELPARRSERWLAGQTVQLTETLALRLEVSGDPTPVPRPIVRSESLPEEPSPEDVPGGPGAAAEQLRETPAQGSKQLAPLAVTLLCVVVGGFLLLMDSSEEEAPPRNVAHEFQALITELEENRPPPGLQPGELRSALQAARIAELRGSKKESQYYYGYLRDLLLARRRADGSFASGVEKKTWDFVEGQLRVAASAEEVAGT